MTKKSNGKGKSAGDRRAYFVTDQFRTGKTTRSGNPQMAERVVFADDDFYACLYFLRRKVSENGRMYRGRDGVLLATRKVVGEKKVVFKQFSSLPGLTPLS
jgi:hypothetical protein